MNPPTVAELRKVYFAGFLESARDVNSKEDPRDAGYRALFEFGRAYGRDYKDSRDPTTQAPE
jgi:hypothetical protein